MVNDARPMRHIAMAVVLGAAGLVATGGRAWAWETPAARPPAPAGKTKPAAKPASTKEVTLTGQLTCAKCGLHEAGGCQNVLVVPAAAEPVAADGAGGSGAATAAGASTKYYLDKNAVAHEHHEKVCRGAVAATVTGRVHEAGGRKILTASSVKID